MMLDADLEDVEEFEPTAIQLKFINPVGPHTEFLAVFALGISDDEIEESDPIIGTVSLGVDLANMFGVYGRAHADLGTNAQVFGQLGLVLIKYEIEVEIFDVSDSESYDDTGLALGFGVSFDLSDQAALVFEYNRFPDVDVEDIADIETTSLSVGIKMTF